MGCGSSSQTTTTAPTISAPTTKPTPTQQNATKPTTSRTAAVPPSQPTLNEGQKPASKTSSAVQKHEQPENTSERQKAVAVKVICEVIATQEGLENSAVQKLDAADVTSEETPKQASRPSSAKQKKERSDDSRNEFEKPAFVENITANNDDADKCADSIAAEEAPVASVLASVAEKHDDQHENGHENDSKPEKEAQPMHEEQAQNAELDRFARVTQKIENFKEQMEALADENAADEKHKPHPNASADSAPDAQKENKTYVDAEVL